MVDLIAEFLATEANNQKLLKAKSKYLKIYTVHRDGLESLMGRNYKKNEIILAETGKKYRICWGDGKHLVFTAEEFNERVIGSEEYENYFKEFPKVLIGGDN